MWIQDERFSFFTKLKTTGKKVFFLLYNKCYSVPVATGDEVDDKTFTQ